MFRFETLEIWHEAVGLADRIYLVSNQFPNHELFTLTAQIRRAAISISANIAEGSATYGVKDLRNFLTYSIRSTAEVVSELFLARQRNYLSQKEFDELYSRGELLIRRISAFRNNTKYHKP